MIREALATQMKRDGVTQAELAERSGVAQPHVSRFLAGKGIGIDKLERLMQAMRLEVKAKGEQRSGGRNVDGGVNLDVGGFSFHGCSPRVRPCGGV